MRQIMSRQMNRLNNNCQRNSRSADFRDMPLIKSLYLIQFHGIDG